MHAVETKFTRPSALTPTLSRRKSQASHRAFSLTELLVVIGIIVLLVGILLVALQAVKVKADETRTRSIMDGFANACMAFQNDHDGKLPGVIPDEVIMANPQGGPPQISSTANALLSLLGGYRVMSPFDPTGGQVDVDYQAFMAAAVSTNSMHEINFGASGWKLVVDLRKIGEGPVVNGKPHAPYLTLKGDETGFCPGLPTNFDEDDRIGLPELIDAWGQPIIYIRRVRDKGPLAHDANAATVQPQFLLAGVAAYLGWPQDLSGGVVGPVEIGELQLDQVHGGSNPKGSILTADTPEQRFQTFAFLVRHAGVSPTITAEADVLYGSPRGSFVLISAGPDGIFYSATDGAGSQSAPVSDLIDQVYWDNPKVIEEYDDVIVFAGG
jgi:type II secretory pathway pseudopilin PulG